MYFVMLKGETESKPSGGQVANAPLTQNAQNKRTTLFICSIEIHNTTTNIAIKYCRCATRGAVIVIHVMSHHEVLVKALLETERRIKRGNSFNEFDFVTFCFVV